MALISNRYDDDGRSSVQLSQLQQNYIRQYNEKITSGIYRLRDRVCECGNTDHELIAKKDRYGIPSNTVICRNCGLIVTSPCLDDESNNSYYDNEYHFIYREEETPSEEKFLERKRNACDIIKFVKKHSGADSGNVLEIGCADGGNVAAFAEAGYTASGIDLSHTYIEYGKEKGLDLYCCDARSFAEKGHRFDLIVLNQVLEHFTDVKRELAVIDQLLEPEGLLFVAVPGVRYLTYGAYYADFLQMLQSAHIYNFTKTTLQNVMGLCGYECIYANEFIYALFKKGKPVQTVTNAYSGVIDFLHTVEAAEENVTKLLIYRFERILSGHGSGEVMLYGTAEELDVLVSGVPDLSCIKGFFYSDSKAPDEVKKYILSLGKNNTPKCLIIADSKQNNVLVDQLEDLGRECGTKVYSVYGEIF